MNRQIYEVTGMTCGGCVSRVKTTLTGFADDVEVTLDPPQAILTNPTLDIDALNIALHAVGHYALKSKTKVLPMAKLQTTDSHQQVLVDNTTSWLSTYCPLLLVFTYILLVCLVVEWTKESFAMQRFMPNFMAGFFLVFSFFKMLDLSGFANSYAMYDVLAKRVPAYGFVYPFIELGLGIAYLVSGHSNLVNLITFFVMVFSSIGVIIAVMRQQKIRCACLGAVFNLPMSTVTIVEDLLMAGMAAIMLM